MARSPLESVRKEKGKTTPSTASSSQISGQSRNKARARTYVDSPEFLQGRLRQMQEEQASAIRMRTMARVGELHLAQSSSSSVDNLNFDEPSEVDGGIDVLSYEDQVEESSHPGAYYTGSNSPHESTSVLESDRRAKNKKKVIEVSGAESDAWNARNDAAAPLSHSVLRKNITARRSLGRLKDRDNVWKTSVPVDQLISRKANGRARDLEYDKEVMGKSSSHTDPQVKTIATQDEIFVRPTPKAYQDRPIAMNQDEHIARTPPQTPPTSSQIPDVTRQHFPPDDSDPALLLRLTKLWIQKKELEDEMRIVGKVDGDGKINALAEEHSDINYLMFTLLQPTLLLNQSQSKSREKSRERSNPVASSSNIHVSSPPRTPKWSFQGESFLIYLQTPDISVPWTAWVHMPVSLLIPASISVFAMHGKSLQPQDIVLSYEDELLDVSFGRLSDYDIGDGDVVVVMVVSTMTRGGYVPERVVPVTGAQFKPQPTHDSIISSTTREGRPIQNTRDEDEGSTMDKRSYEKLKQTFKCPKFSGQPKDWKLWHKGFQRYLSIWELDHVLNPDFFNTLPLSSTKIRDNKLVYYIIEDATQGSALASSYVRQAPSQNGFEAYYTLHDGFVFAGSTTSTILLNELANFRFKANEAPTELIMRLEELFQDLEMLPDNSAMIFNDNQRVGYLLSALRHEPQWEGVASTIVSAQLKGDMTFKRACNELKIRCEADKAYMMMDKQVISKRKVYKAAIVAEDDHALEDFDESTINEGVPTLVSTTAKRLNKVAVSETDKNGKKKKGKKVFEQRECIAKGCSTLTTYLLCGLHYHSLLSGKTPILELDNNWGNAKYNSETSSIEYPEKVPEHLLPKRKLKQ
jgi:hypothetical protein